MGTRGAIAVRVGGVEKAAYNHFDSYPSELGENTLKFAREMDREAARALAEKLQMAPQDRIATPEEVEHLKPWTDLSVSGGTVEDWYCLLRNTQGDLAATLKAGFYYPGGVGQDEWSYVIDFDAGVFEVWEGGQKEAKFPLDSLPPTLEGVINEYY